tara:strand:+ start:1525 stop:2439 length:915 start_codon:yes stop_codon:yes gene_type:complete
MECKICLEGETNINNRLITPCDCDGTHKYIHVNCLIQWINSEANIHHKKSCRECGGKYMILKRHKNEQYNLLNSNQETHENNNICMRLFFGSVIFLLFYIAENNITFIIAEILCFKDCEIKISRIIDLIFQDNMSIYIFNTALFFFIVNICFNIFYVYTILFKIKRKKDFCMTIMGSYISFQIIILSFIILFNLFTEDIDLPIQDQRGVINTYVYLCFIFVLIYPACLFLFIKNHERAIHYINNKNNNIIVVKGNVLYDFIAYNYYIEEFEDLMLDNIVEEYNNQVEILDQPKYTIDNCNFIIL